MIQIQIQNIIRFLDEQYPAVLLELQEDNSISSWVGEKISLYGSASDEAEFFLLLSHEMGISAYLYIREILEEDFTADFHRLHAMGVLKFEIINMIQACTEVFAEIPLHEENEKNRLLRLAVMGVISDYLYQASVA